MTRFGVVGKVLAVIVMTLLVIGVVTVPLDLKAQWIFAAVIVVGTLVIGRRKNRKATMAIGILSLLVSTRYMFWRTTQTLEFQSLPEILLGVGLYMAELYAWVILALGLLQTGMPLPRKSIEIIGNPDDWPTIDVYVPTYNESLTIVQNTVFAAMDMDYPAERFRVFILDDGSRAEFRAFARSAGCGYLTRTDNLHAKAGNLNAAMKKTHGELIAIFDCDHVPTRSFLQMTVGWFQKDKALAVLQTPHHFYSADPAQRNLGSVTDLPGEGDLFYGAVQAGNDLWNATFFCGSCAVIRREALQMTNGFAGETVTEDAHTALKLQRMGWNTAYLGARLSAGLATERLVVHIGQRIRWARGMTQIFRIDNPLFGKGLTWQQRLCYTNAMLHFQFPLPRIVFLTSPLAYLIFGQNIIHASASLILAYAAPHLFCSTTSGERAQGGDRRPFWGEIYETILAFHLVKPTVLTLFQPRKGKFNVTDKGSLLTDTYFDLSTLRPHIICISLIILGILFATAKRLFFPAYFNIQTDTLVLNTVWALFSLVILLAAVSVGREQRQTREYIRINAQLPVTLYMNDGYVIDAVTSDLSMGGLAVELPAGFVLQDRRVTFVSLPMGDEKFTLPVDTVKVDGGQVSVRFHALEPRAARHLVRAVMGRADAWEPDAPRPPVSGFRSIWDIIVIDAVTLKRILHLNRSERKRDTKRGNGAVAIATAVAIMAVLTTGWSNGARAAAIPAQAVAAPAPAPAPAPTGGTRQQRLTFRDLQVKTPIRLAGTRGEIGIPFGMRANEVVTNATLVLNFAWSPAMLGDLSQLVVLLNGEVVQTLPLRPGDAAGQNLRIAVNPALFLPGDNQLNLRLVGHYARDCEDPFHSSLWANVSNTRSGFDLTVQSLPIGPDLGRLPGPFFDRHDNAPLKIPFVYGGAPSNGELEASGSIASWFGQMASYRGFSFKPTFNQLPRGNAIVFLTPRRPVAGLTMDVTGPAVAVIANPTDPYGQLLVIMGRNDAELKQAAGAVAAGRGVFGGARMALDGVRIPAYPRYGAPRWLRTDRPVQLGELVEAYTLQGMGLPPGPLRTQFRVAPDLFFWPRQGARLDLHYRYPVAPWLDRQASRLDVSINNQYLRTLTLSGEYWWDKLLGGHGTSSQTSRADVILPSYNLFGQNELIFDYNLILADKKRCEGTLPDNVRVSVLPDSTIDMTQASHAMHMPNLATFAGSGYPFTVRPDLAETVVLFDKQITSGSIEAFLTLMGRFGDATGAPTTGLTVLQDVDQERMAGKDILVIGKLSIMQSPELFGAAPVKYQNGKLRVTERSIVERIFDLMSPYDRSAPDQVDEFLYGTDAFTGFIGFESPFDSGRSVVAMVSNDEVALVQLAAGLADTKFNAQVQGDVSVVNGEGLTSFAVGDGYWVGSLPFWTKIAYWLSQRPLLMAAAGLLIALLLAGPVYLYFLRQERRRMDGTDQTDGTGK